jgi:hypothetical protein
MEILDQVTKLVKTLNCEEITELYILLGLPTDKLKNKKYPYELSPHKAIKMYGKLSKVHTNDTLLSILEFFKLKTQCIFYKDDRNIISVYKVENMKIIMERKTYFCATRNGEYFLCENCKNTMFS